MSGLFCFPSHRAALPNQESNMHTKPLIEYSAVPSFRRRLRRGLKALLQFVAPKARVDIPDYLRRDIGLSHGNLRPKAHAPRRATLTGGYDRRYGRGVPSGAPRFSLHVRKLSC